jgi:hypothetical protein
VESPANESLFGLTDFGLMIAFLFRAGWVSRRAGCRSYT